MAKHTLVAVGGSGQSAAIAYLRLATISGMSPDLLPNIYVIDADVKDRQGADAKPSLFSSLKALFSQLVQGVADIQKPKLELIYPYNQSGASDVLSSSTTFADYILNQGGKKEDMRQVIDALFSKKNKSSSDRFLSEQDVPLSKGFMARPNVGATTFFDKLHQNKNTLEPALYRLRDTVVNGQSQSITIVVGSSFGGTGSGVAPSLAQQLVRWAEDAHQKPLVALFMTLPWFNPIEQQTQANAEPTHGTRSAQLKNTAGGLRYYATSKSFKHMDVFVADYCGHIHARNDDSNSEQPEYEHVFNILLASQIQNYFINKLSHPSFVDKEGVYTFFQSQQAKSNTLSFDAGNSALLAFSVDDKLKQDIKHWLHEAQSLRLALRYSARFIANDFKLIDASKRERPEGFNVLAVAVAKKDGRPSMLTQSKKLVFFKGVDQPATEIYLSLSKKLEGREKQLANSIAWLNKLSANCPELQIDDASLLAHPDSLYEQFAAMRGGRNVEVASIRLFEDALGKANTKTLQSFEVRIDSGQHALDAAAEEIEDQIRAIIRKYNVQPRNHDEQVHPSTPGKINELFIPMHVGSSAQVVNGYLQFLDLNTLVDDGKNRAGDEVSKQDKNHPATLNELTHFGIPSPWGAALIELWNQESAFTMVKKNPGQMKDVADRLEAILWGIFTKKLTVKNISGNSAGSIASTAIRVRNMETNTRDDESYNSIAVAVSTQTGQVVAANYPSVGWFAAPNQTGMLLEWWDDAGDLFMQLPSEISLDPQRMFASAYEARMIKSFVEWGKQILEKADSHSSTPAAAWIPVLQYVHERLIDRIPAETLSLELPEAHEYFLLKNRDSVLKVPVVYVKNPYDEIVNTACCTSLIVLEDETKDGGFVYKKPDSPLKTSSKGTAKLVGESGILKERAGNGNYMSLRYQLTLPEGVFVVDRKAKVVFIRVQQVVWPNFKVLGWRFYYAGGTATDNQDLINQASPQYAYHLYSNQPDGSKKRVQYMQGDEVKEFTTPLFFDRNYELYGVPDVLVLLERAAGAEQYQEVGVIHTKLQDLPERTNKFKLALDFGTSHSCVVAMDASDRKIQHIDFTRPSADNDLLLKVIETPDGDDYLFDEFRFVAPFAARESTHDLDRNVLPSEFRFNKWLEPSNPLKEIESGIRYLTILPMQFKKPNAEKTIKETGALGDFKWGASKKSSSLTSTIYESKEADLSRLYIKQLLRKAIAMLRVQGYNQLTTFRATFPEAFSTQHTGLFATELKQIFDQIASETDLIIDQKIDQAALLRLKDFIQGTDTGEGQELTETSHGLVSESIAALKTASKTSERNALSDKKLQIVLDMGGGSTDVAAFLSDAILLQSNGSKLPMQLTDSIRYAGHDILQLLSTIEITKQLDEQFKYDEKKELLQQCLRVIKIAMRDAKAVHRLQTHLVEPDFAINAKRNVKDFFEGLFEYTRQLIESFQKVLTTQGIDKLSVGIVLLGNGWRLGNLVYTNVDLNTVEGLKHEMQDYLRKGLSNIESLSVIFPSSSNVSVKESIAYGSLLYDPSQEISKNSSESVYTRTRYSFVGGSKLKFAAQDTSLPNFLTQQKAAQRRDLSAAPQIEEISVFPQHSSFLHRMDSVKGQEGQGLHFAKIDLNKRLQLQWRSAEDEVMISPMKEFLEHIWKPILLKEV